MQPVWFISVSQFWLSSLENKHFCIFLNGRFYNKSEAGVQVSGIIPVLSLSLGAEMGSTFSFNYVNFNLLAVHREAASLERLLGLCKINLSHVQALADRCCSAQADAFGVGILS